MTAPDTRALLKSAFLRIEDLEAKLAARDAEQSAPLAVIGVGCRFPAGGNGPDAFFEALERGADGVRRIGPERWPAEPTSPDRPEVRWAGLLDALDGFDAAFFGISPREAERLDPQQRLLLEVTWEALEHAGLRIDRLLGSKTGVFVGMCSVDYAHLVREAGAYDTYSGTGNTYSTAAGRIAYTLGLQGPCLTVDTACSSSLVAVHLACRSLRQKESDLAVVGGVNVILDPTNMAILLESQAISPDGRCRAFDAGANGFVRGEGCGVVVLKRLRDAERDGDPILAVIRGSAVNQDGRSTGLTAPNVLAQQAMLRQALANARVSAADIGYVETHGTGTLLGDPIEFEALREVLGKPREDGSRCVLGALKTNVGHMEGAAGIGGLIKAVLCLQRGVIPKNLNFDALNPRMSLEGTPFMIPTEDVPWARNGKPRRAGVSAFGISGTNAHVILEEAPRAPQPVLSAKEASSVLLPLSAKSPEALAALAGKYQAKLAQTETRLSDIVYTASVRRTHHAFRLGCVGGTKEEIAGALGAYLRGEMPAGLAKGAAPLSPPKVVFVFPGQGSQWVGMGQTLLAEEPAFREAIDACDKVIQRELGFSVVEELGADEARSRLKEIDVVQPVLFAIEVALAALWRSWGITPDVVVGHSMGEVAAAYVAGALSLDDAAKVICRRSRLLRTVSGKGAMALVDLPMSEVSRAIEGYEAQLSVAVSNGPRSTVIAGDPGPLEIVLEKLGGEGVFCRRVKVDVASHSPQMDPLRADLIRALAGLSPTEARIPMWSTVTGERLQGAVLGPEYWADNLRRPVLFSRVTRSLVAEGHALFLEMSPHPILVSSLEENLQEAQVEGAAIGSLRREADNRRSLLESLVRLYAHGVSVEWARLYPEGGRVVELPMVPWQRKRYWVTQKTTERRASEERVRRQTPRGDSWLGESYSVSALPSAQFWDVDVGVDEPFPFAERRTNDEVILPWALELNMLLDAARRFGGEAWVIEDAVFLDEPKLGEHERVAFQLALKSSADGWAFSLASAPRLAAGGEGGPWRNHGEGRIRRLAADTERRERTEDSVDTMTARCREIPVESFYANLASRGLSYGSGLRVVERVWARPNEALGYLSIPTAMRSSQDDNAWLWALLDGALQLLHAALPADVKAGVSFRVAGFGKAHLFGACLPTMWGLARLLPGEPLRASLTLFDEAGRIAVELVDIRLEAVLVRGDQADLDDPATIERILRGIYRQVTGSGGTDVDAELPLNQVGVDSLMYAQILRRAEQALGVAISIRTMTRSGVSLQSLTLRVLKDLLVAIRRDALASPPPGEPAGAIGTSPAAEDASVVEVERIERDEEVPEIYRALLGDEIPLETFLVTLSSGEVIEVLCAGSGAPLLLLPPLMASIPIWVFQVSAFWRDYRVMVINYPGYGRSTTPSRTLSPARLARRIAALIDGFGIREPVDLVGWSLGGLIGQEFALAMPHRLRSLSLVNTVPRLEEEDTVRTMESLLRRLTEDLNRITVEESAQRTMALAASQREASFVSSAEYMAEVLRFDARERLCGISAPTLVVQGLEDTCAVPRYGRFMSGEIPRAQYHESERGGHFVPLQLPDEFNDVLRRFLARSGA